MKLRNLTFSDLKLYRLQDTLRGDNGTLTPNLGAAPFCTLRSEGYARAGQGEDLLGAISVNDVPVSVYLKTYGDTLGLPAPEKDTYLIVSGTVYRAAKASGRTTQDLLVPTHPVKDKFGELLGWTAFARMD